MGFDPISLTLMAASGAMQAYSQKQQGDASQDTAEYNAKLSERQAQAQRHDRQVNSTRMREDMNRKLATYRAQAAANGVISDEGSPLAVYSESRDRFDEQIDQYTQQAITRESLMMDQARMQRYQGEEAAKAGKISAVGTLLGTAAKTASGYAGGVKQGSIKDHFGLYKTQY